MSENIFPKTIKDEFIYSFSVEQFGLYVITLVARCRSAKQIGQKGGEDLWVEIDGRKFREVPAHAKPQYQDIPTAWNGSRLNGLSKTVVFLLILDSGEHELVFIPDNGAIIETQPQVKLVSNYNQINFNIEQYAEDGDRRPWFTFALVDLPLKSFSADITVNYRFRDSDDVKLLVDGQVKKNNFSILRRSWLWSANLLTKVLKKERQKKTLEENLNKGIHYIEFWADRMPVLHQIVLDLGEVSSTALTGRIALYPDIESADFVRLRDRAKLSSAELGHLKHGETVEILERVTRGDHVVNKSDVWHKVRYKNLVGFVLSSFVEIEGEERERIITKIAEQARIRNIDPDLAVALAGCESRYKPYAVSETNALGIFQLTSIARKHLREQLNFDINDDDESLEAGKNIAAGLTYLAWLIGIYKGTRDEYKKIIAAWNAGHSLIPVEGQVNYAHIKDDKKRQETQRLVNCAEQNRKSKNWQYILTAMGIILALGLGVHSLYPLRFVRPVYQNAQVLGAINSSGNTRFIFEHPNFNFNIESITVTASSPEPFVWVTDVEYTLPDRGFHKQYSGGLYNAYLYDQSLGHKLVIVRGEGKSVLTSILDFDSIKKTLTEIEFIDKDGTQSDTLCCVYMLHIPKENGVQYDIGMPDFSTDPPTLKVYEYNGSQNAFIEQNN